MKRSKMLAKKNGFDKVTTADIWKIGVRNHHEMRILRWDQAMLRWPNYDQNVLKTWVHKNGHVLNGMAKAYYSKHRTLFKVNGWEAEDLSNVLLWHAFIYLNTPYLKHKNSDEYVWSHIKQRFVETVQILQKRSSETVKAGYSSHTDLLYTQEGPGQYELTLKNRLLSLSNRHPNLFDDPFVRKTVKELFDIETPEEQKKFLQNKLNRVRIRKNGTKLKLILSIYDYV